MKKNRTSDEIKKLKNLLAVIKKTAQKTGDFSAYEDYFQTVRLLDKEKEGAGLVYSRNLRTLIETAKPKDDKTAKMMAELYDRSLLYDSKRDFDSFIRFMEGRRRPEVRFYEPRRAQLLTIVQDLQDLEDGKISLLTTSLPPRAGKSVLSLFYCAWLMGKYPDKSIIYTTYSGTLCANWYDALLDILKSEEYRWTEVFRLKIHETSSLYKWVDIGKSHMYHTITCRSMEQSITGVVEASKLLIVDDPITGFEEAMNEERLAKKWEQYTTDFLQRKLKGGAEWHIATRWSLRDIIGRLKAEKNGDETARFHEIPALDDNGESNFDYLDDKGFDTDYYLERKRLLDPVLFEAIYMNQPIEKTGQLYPVNELRRFFELPEEDPDHILAVVDPKEKGKDYIFSPVGYMYGQDCYIVDCVCNQSLPKWGEAEVAEMLFRHQVQRCQIESNVAGGRWADGVKGKLDELGGYTHITTKWNNANKETRILHAAGWVKANCLFKSDYKPSTPYYRMMEQLSRYSLEGKNAFDDVPDGFAMLFDLVSSLDKPLYGTATAMRRMF
jgi:predicted phage terminase large subunit-like protein